jgi:hypothetical protein
MSDGLCYCESSEYSVIEALLRPNIDPPYDYYGRYSCTDPTWKACPDICTYDNTALYVVISEHYDLHPLMKYL